MTLFVAVRFHVDEDPLGKNGKGKVETVLETLEGRPGVVFVRLGVADGGKRLIETALRAAPSRPDIVVIIRAYMPGRRGVDANITDVFPGDPEGNTEERLAAELEDVVQDDDLLLDLHLAEFGPDFAFFGSRCFLRYPRILEMASLLDGDQCMVYFTEVHPANSLPGYCGFELAPDSPVINRLPELVMAIAVDRMEARDLELFAFTGWIEVPPGVSVPELERPLPNFTRLPEHELVKLNVLGTNYAVCWSGPGRFTGLLGEFAGRLGWTSELTQGRPVFPT